MILLLLLLISFVGGSIDYFYIRKDDAVKQRAKTLALSGSSNEQKLEELKAIQLKIKAEEARIKAQIASEKAKETKKQTKKLMIDTKINIPNNTEMTPVISLKKVNNWYGEFDEVYAEWRSQL